MSRRPRRNHSAAFKAKVAIEALADGKTIAEIAQKHDVCGIGIVKSPISSAASLSSVVTTALESSHVMTLICQGTNSFWP